MDITMIINFLSVILLLFACAFLVTRKGVPINVDSYVAKEDSYLSR